MPRTRLPCKEFFFNLRVRKHYILKDLFVSIEPNGFDDIGENNIPRQTKPS